MCVCVNHNYFEKLEILYVSVNFEFYYVLFASFYLLSF